MTNGVKAVMAKQFMMGMGLTDPVVINVVEKLVGGEFSTPSLVSFSGDSFPVPEGAETTVVTASSATEEFTLLLVCKKKS